MEWKKIDITEVGGFRIGSAQDADAMTGLTAILFDAPNTGGIDISGGGPACREPGLLFPTSKPQSLHALVLSGGSAYGLDAAAGVMRYLEERGVGYRVGKAIVPLVCQSCIFDLSFGSAAVRPDAAMGYAACVDAERGVPPRAGLSGAGMGATVGKLCGMARAQKSGVGFFAAQIGELKIGAAAVVNAVGDVYDYKTGRKRAGTLTPDRAAFADTGEALCSGRFARAEHANTTISAVLTNARLTQPQMAKVASMARAAYGQCIRPVGTMADGDTIYAFSVGGSVPADVSLVGALAAQVLSEAILDAVTSVHMPDEEFLKRI